jgi:hypothetical protein
LSKRDITIAVDVEDEDWLLDTVYQWFKGDAIVHTINGELCITIPDMEDPDEAMLEFVLSEDVTMLGIRHYD